jgi:hypothetical protein
MLIAVAGSYTADTEEQMHKNLDAMNDACAKVYEKRHIPVVGVNNTLPIVFRLENADIKTDIMNISLAMVERCDAILLIGASPGALQERDLILSKGLPVFYSIEEIPDF